LGIQLFGVEHKAEVVDEEMALSELDC